MMLYFQCFTLHSVESNLKSLIFTGKILIQIQIEWQTEGIYRVSEQVLNKDFVKKKYAKVCLHSS